jgi:hypothetical protein
MALHAKELAIVRTIVIEFYHSVIAFYHKKRIIGAIYVDCAVNDPSQLAR